MFGRISLTPLAAALALGLSMTLPLPALAQSATKPASAETPKAQAAEQKAQKAQKGQSADKAQKAQKSEQKAQKSQASKPARKPAAKVAEPEPVIGDATPEQLAAAQQIFTGSSQCEFNQTISVEASDKHPGYVDVKQGKRSWLMKPVLSATGALRLEDVRSEALMIQIGTKSMLLNQKTGQRLVDDCRHPRQMEVAAPSSPGMLR